MVIFAAVASALHQKIKFLIENQVGEVKDDQKMDRKCYVEEVRVEKKAAKMQQSEREKPKGHDHIHLIDETVSVTSEEECDKIVIHAPSGKSVWLVHYLSH